MSHPELEFAPVCNTEQLDAIAAMAREIWYEYYVPIIGRAQVDYMVTKFQTAEAMAAQIASGYEYFVVRRDASEIGYFALQPQPDEGRLFLSKLYLLARSRGAGTGRACMEFIERLGRERGLGMLWLTVNKGNPSVKAYERLGFRIAAEIVIDIGDGFVMDDYRMQKDLRIQPVGPERQV
ncbi:MAG TPA: GNAT family N-acetyltransferase [Steroidobacteraceae bacterium]|nr:GNAT family N-acetyltransferase [Steroidobacteraceae bacterium]